MPNRAYEQSLVYYIRTMIHSPEEAKLSVEDLPEELKPLGEALRTLGESIRTNQNAADETMDRHEHMDVLTGAWDREYGARALEETWQKGKSYVMGVVVLDDLEACIGNYDETEGDRFILAAYHLLEDGFPQDTFLFRMEKDRFLLMSISMPLEAMELTLENARQQLQESSRKNLDYLRSFSFGCAYADAMRGGSYKQSVAEAEQRLKRCRLKYLAERDGRTDEMDAMDNIDPLTNLYNVYRFMEELRRCKAEKKAVSVMMIGVNQFRRINNTYGFEYGNRVLKLFADELLQLVQGYGRVFRMDGVKFCVLLDHMIDQSELETLYGRICDIARDRLFVGERVVHLMISGGALSFSQIDLEENSVLAELEYAMSISKKSGHGRLTHFNDNHHEKARRRLELIDTLVRSVLFRDFHGFLLEYQPQVRQDGQIIGAEALIRWQDEEWGRVPPNDFIPILENNSCFYELGLWILQTAMREVRPIIDAHPDFAISINVSYRQLEQPKFKTDVLALVQRMNFPARNLTLELTEHCRSIQQEILSDNLNFLRDAGISISADDFGTGYSSLALLRDLPFDAIKIDRTFISNIVENNPDQIIVKSTIQCAKDFGINVCIEGVEDIPTLTAVDAYHPDYYQGYLYSRPVPLETLYDLCLNQEVPRIQIEQK